MKALVWRGSGDIQLEEVEDPRLEAPTDALVRLTTTAICGADLHVVRGTLAQTLPGTILGREGVGVVEAVGSSVRNLVGGDRVVIPSSIACGVCHNCRKGWTAQCARADSSHPRAGSLASFGDPSHFICRGLQAERARIPHASFNLVKLPAGISDGQAILISDAFPAGYFGAELAGIEEGQCVAVLGCGPVGLFAIASARLMGACRIFAVDTIPERLAQARRLGAEIIDFEAEDPVEAVLEMTSGQGVERTIEAVGIDAYLPRRGPAAHPENGQTAFYKREAESLFGKAPVGFGWHPGDAPSLTLRWCVEMLAAQGTAAIVGAFPESMDAFPIGRVFGRNLTIRAGMVHHRMIIPRLIELVMSGRIDPLEVVAPTMESGFGGLEEAYRRFDRREGGWTKVALLPG